MRARLFEEEEEEEEDKEDYILSIGHFLLSRVGRQRRHHQKCVGKAGIKATAWGCVIVCKVESHSAPRRRRRRRKFYSMLNIRVLFLALLRVV